MGAIPYAGGTLFRVWAPFATSVCVAGTFNQWNPTVAPLSAEGTGYWSAEVAGAAIGDRYKYVLRGPFIEGERWRNDPYARSVTSSVGESIITDREYAWQSTDYRTPAWNELVIYELHVGSFAFDPGAPNKRGNFDSVVAKLDYIRDLGFNAIQVMPADEFPGDTSWGYNPAHLFAIEHAYGGPNGFRRLVDAAHARGLAVIFDIVFNHLGPADLDLWQFDGWSQDGHGGIYFYNDWRRTTPWGDTRPDYGRGEVRRFLRDNALHWLEESQCDGLRWDATGWIRNVYGNDNDNDAANDLPDGYSLMQWINGEVASRQPWKIMIAEDMNDNEWLTKPSAMGGAGFGAQWGAAFMHAVRENLIVADDARRNMHSLRDVIRQRYNDNAFQRVVYTESHDEVAASAGLARLPEQIWPGHADSYFSQKRSTLAAALIFTAPGIPMIFMGQEFLESGAWSDARQLDWSKTSRFAGIVNLYRDLAHLRRNFFNSTRGLQGHGVDVHHVNDRDKVLAFHRWAEGGPGDDVVVVLNFANRAYPSYRIGLPRAGRWSVRFNSDWSGYSPAFGNHPSRAVDTLDGEAADELPFAADLSIGPYTAIVLSQNP